MAKKTQAMRVLEGAGITYSVLTYDKSVRDAVIVAEQIGIPAQEVFKTLVVVRTSKKPLLVMVPANRQLSLKELASHIGEKKVKLASHKEAERLTGLQVGGISALALLNKGFDVILDEAALAFEWLVISAGQKGFQIQVEVKALIELTHAEIFAVTA